MHADRSASSCRCARPPAGRALAFLTILVLFFGLVASGCRGPRAARYQRMRRSFDSSYRVALLRPAAPLPGLPVVDARPLMDDVLADMRQRPRLRVTDPDTVEAHLRQQGHQGPPPLMDPSALEALGEGLDLEAFVIPVGLPGNRPDEAILQLRLVNGYTGNVLWRSQTPVASARSRAAWASAFSFLMTELMGRLESLASIQTLLRTSPELPPTQAQTPGAAVAPPVTDGTADVFRVASPGTTRVGPHQPSAPAWEAGAEQVTLDLPSFRRMDAIPDQGPLTTLVVSYAAGATGTVLTLTLLDEREPAAARRRLEDLFAGAEPQVVGGCRTFALRDPADGTLAVGLLLGRFVAQIRAAAGAEASVAELTEALVEANGEVLSFYRSNPSPPAPTAASPREVVREIHDVRTVEVTRSVVPTVQILLDGRQLSLIRDDRLSTAERLVLTLAPQAQAPSPIGPQTPAPTPTGPTPPTAAATAPAQATVAPISAPTLGPEPTPAAPPVTPDGPDPAATTVPAARIRFDLGQRYLAASRFDAAEAEFRRALVLDPSYEAPRRELRRMRDTFGLTITIPEPPPPTPLPVPKASPKPSPPPASTPPAPAPPSTGSSSSPPPTRFGGQGTWVAVTVLVVLGGMLALILLPRGGRRGH